MSVVFNSDGSTRSVNGESFKDYVFAVWEEEGTLDMDDYDPDDVAQIRAWVKEWESE